MFSLATSAGPLDSTQRAAANPAETVVSTYRERIPELMAEQGVPGLAVALVDRERALWVVGFGHVDGGGSAPVTADTIFSVQSMSKLFTATAVMQAVAAGRLDLDAPITTYLPEFTVHSAFEQHPERKITLRMLLSHTAGFTHEAPVGNNNELDPGTFDAHVRSISNTWLRFPVGTGYAYSNLGIDLAGYILQRVEGKPFAQAVRDSLLEPLGMRRSTFGRAEIRAAANRAVGHVHPYPHPPLDVPMTSAGGLYASAADLGRFLRFQLNDGSIDGRVVLDRKWLDEMRTVPPPRAGAPAGYALGVARHRWNTWPDLLDHGGAGYGFLSDLWWVPDVGIGIAVLTNSDGHQLQNKLALSILSDLLRAPGVYRDRLLALPSRPPADDPDGLFEPPAGLASLVANTAMRATGDQVSRWAAYAGAYRRPIWGYLDPSGPPDRFVVDRGVPHFEARDPETESLARHRLVEVEPGLFLADNGETLDMRGQVATWRNFPLVRVSGGPSQWQWAILGAAALVALAWLVAALARAVRRSDSRSSPTAQRTETRRWRRVAALVASATALLTLVTVALLVSMPGLVDAGFQGWLDFSLSERLALQFPLAVVVMGASTAALVAWGWVGRWWSRAVTLQYTGLAVATASLGVLLAGWHLIGWAMT
ncbi:MAG TPA: serine hydrolase domain-containing protein [Gaiellaceae bacterium]|nr:serine hydrolase domain-containing protein [Gaiellaceae bacterium]